MKHVHLLATVALACSAQAQQYCAVGSTDWVAGCQASCTDSWSGGNCPQACVATAPPGYVIVNHRVTIKSNNNGGHSASRVAAGQTFDYKRRVEQAYSYEIDAAGKAGNKGAEAKLKQEMNSAIAEAESFASSHQAVRLNVSASKHGSMFDQKRGWFDGVVELQVRCVVPQNLEDQLMRKYALQ
jgi:hypothetical protein